MTDIIDRLRQYAENDMRVEDVCLSAAGEIERLRETLMKISNPENVVARIDLADRLFMQAAFEAATYEGVDTLRLVEAASEIKKLQNALRYYANKKEEDWKNGDDGVIARAALEGK